MTCRLGRGAQVVGRRARGLVRAAAACGGRGEGALSDQSSSLEGAPSPPCPSTDSWLLAVRARRRPPLLDFPPPGNAGDDWGGGGSSSSGGVWAGVATDDDNDDDDDASFGPKWSRVKDIPPARERTLDTPEPGSAPAPHQTR